MFLAIDLGNTTVKAGIFDHAELVLDSFIDHPQIPTIKTYHQWLKPLIDKYPITAIGIASVKPPLRHLILKALNQLTDILPTLLTRKSYPTFSLRIDNPDELGMDLLVDAVAAHHLYGHDAIIIDVGTATKVMAIKQQGFEGVAIAPGILTSFKALNQNASLIKTMKVISPKEVFGKNTVTALASGIIFGHVHLIEGLIKQGKSLFQGKEIPLIITGGYAPLLLPYFSLKLIHDAQLSLKGIQRCQ